MDSKRFQRVEAIIDVLMDYKTGQLNLENAVNQFCSLSEFKREHAEKYLMGMTRKNVIPISSRRPCQSRK